MGSSGNSGAMGPLVVCKENPRYFADPDGHPVYLTGSHTWAALHERMLEETPVFDYSAWLDFMVRHKHNFLRLWAWEHTAWMQFTLRRINYGPNRYRRTGPGAALEAAGRNPTCARMRDRSIRFTVRAVG